MGVLKTAIAAGRWDLAAHALILAAVKTLDGETENAPEADHEPEISDANQAKRVLS